MNETSVNKIKVVWICHLMNPEIEKHIPYVMSAKNKFASKALSFFAKIFTGSLRKRILNLKNLITPKRVRDTARWNTNGIKEFEKIKDVDLYVVAPLSYIHKEGLFYDERGIHYRFFHDQRDDFLDITYRAFKKKLFNKGSNYLKNRKAISKIITDIKPDIVHIIGADCPEFSLATVDIPANIPVIAQLQSLQRYSIRIKKDQSLQPLVDAETKVLKRANYFGTAIKKFKEIVISEINPSIKHLNISLALTEKVDYSDSEKKFDFVYFANNINKAVDLAIEAFAIARETHPDITLDIIGGSTSDYRAFLKKRIQDLNLEDSVTYEGLLPSHEDVLHQIKFSRFALLPLRTDFVSGTIRESMAAGLPVVTTITGGTPTLNEKSQTVLLSPIGDNEALAKNMSLLLDNPELAETLKENAYKIFSERESNAEKMRKWRDAYFACIRNFNQGVTIPTDLL